MHCLLFNKGVYTVSLHCFAILLSFQWRGLLSELIADPLYSSEKVRGEPVMFWLHYLTNEQKTVSWQNKADIRWLVTVALALPSTIAEAERGFSYLTHVKYDRRSSLSAETLRNIMRIRANGPDVEKFDALEYASAWIKHHQSAGDPPKGPRKDTDEDGDDFDFMSQSSLY